MGAQFFDGENTLLDIAERSGLPFTTISNAAQLLFQGDLLSVIADGEPSEAAPENNSRRAVLVNHKTTSATAGLVGTKSSKTNS